jgi:hypothetical protein
MTLDPDEFIRRFLLHVLPQGFVRIRHYGLLSNCRRELRLSWCRQLLGVVGSDETAKPESRDWKARYQRLTGEAIDLCPACRQGHLLRVEVFPPTRPSRSSLRRRRLAPGFTTGVDSS